MIEGIIMAHHMGLLEDQGRAWPVAEGAVKVLTEPGRYNDGNGLYLFIRDTGQKGWILRYRLGSKQRDMGLGSCPEVSLAEAR